MDYKLSHQITLCLQLLPKPQLFFGGGAQWAACGILVPTWKQWDGTSSSYSGSAES